MKISSTNKEAKDELKSIFVIFVSENKYTNHTKNSEN